MCSLLLQSSILCYSLHWHAMLYAIPAHPFCDLSHQATNFLRHLYASAIDMVGLRCMAVHVCIRGMQIVRRRASKGPLQQ